MSAYLSEDVVRFYLRTIICRCSYCLLLFTLVSIFTLAMGWQGMVRAETLTGGAIRGQIIDHGGQPLNNIRVMATEQSTNGMYTLPFPYNLSMFPPWATEESGGPLSTHYGTYGYYGTPWPSYPDFSLPELYRSLSQADGSFVLDNLPEGRYSVWAYDPQGRGFGPSVLGLNTNQSETGPMYSAYSAYSSSYSASGILPVRVQSGKTAGPFILTMIMGGKLSGLVTDAANGSGISGAMIQAAPQGEELYRNDLGAPFLVSSGSNGDFIFSCLAEGKYRLSVVDAKGYILHFGGGYVESGTGLENLYSVAAGQETAGCNLTLEAGGVISGRITSQTTGEPITEATVSCLRLETGYGYYSQSSPVLSGADGNYRLEGLKPGDFIVMVNCVPGFEGAYYPNTQDQGQAQKVRVNGTEETVSIDFQLAPRSNMGTIRGRIIDRSTGLPLAGIMVNLNKTYDQATMVDGVTTPASSAFPDPSLATTGVAPSSLTDLAPTVIAPAVVVPSPPTVVPPTVIASAVVVPSPPIVALPTIIAPTGFVPPFPLPTEIWAVDPGGFSSSSSSYISLPSLCYTSYPVQSDAEGWFEFTNLESAKYQINASDPAGTYLPGYYPEYTKGEKYIDLAENQTIGNIDITLSRGGCLEGQILDGSNPLAGVQVMVLQVANGLNISPIYAPAPIYYGSYPEAPAPVYYGYPSGLSQGLSDTEGKFSLCGLSDGEYVLLAEDLTGRNYRMTYCLDINADGEQPRVISVSSGSLTTGLVISMKDGAFISGRVVDKDGQPLAGIIVRAQEDIKVDIDTDADQMEKPYIYPTSGHTLTGEDGSYTLAGLPEGVYTIRATDPDEEYMEDCYSGLSVSPPSGFSAPYLVLSLGASLSGRVTSADGQPLAGINVRIAAEGSDYTEDEDEDGISSNQCESYNKLYASAYTEKDGTYRITGLTAGNYRLEAEDYQNDYLPSQYPGDSPSGAVTLAEGEQKANLDFCLSRGGIIIGLILDQATAEPLSGIVVKARAANAGDTPQSDYADGYYPQAESEEYDPAELTYPDDRLYETAYYSNPSDSQGLYTLVGLPAGTYLISLATYQDYLPQYYLRVSSPTEATLITIDFGQTVEGIDFSLSKKGSISGRVVDEFDQKPLAGVMVMAIPASSEGMTSSEYPSAYYPYSSYSSSSSSGPYGYEGYGGSYIGYYYQFDRTDADGLYTIRSLDEGDYRIIALDPYYIYAKEYYKDADHQDKATIVHVGRSEVKDGIDMELQVGETYSGADNSLRLSTDYTYAQTDAYPLYGNLYGGLGAASLPSAFLSSTDYALYGAYDATLGGLSGGVQYSAYGLGATSPSGETQINTLPPEIISSNHVDKITAGRAYTYQIEVKDQNIPLTYSLERGTEGITIDSGSGLVQWQPGNESAGQFIVQVKVDNGSGQIALQTFRLRVEADLTPPEEIQNQTANKGDGKVTLSWTPPADRDGDLADQILYIQKDQTYGAGISLGKTATGYTVKNLINGQRYTFKITSRDELGNESNGVTVTATPQKTSQSQGNLSLSWYTGFFSNSFFPMNNLPDLWQSSWNNSLNIWSSSNIRSPSLTTSSIWPTTSFNLGRWNGFPIATSPWENYNTTSLGRGISGNPFMNQSIRGKNSWDFSF